VTHIPITLFVLMVHVQSERLLTWMPFFDTPPFMTPLQCEDKKWSVENDGKLRNNEIELKCVPYKQGEQ
jgi:hypothetical protein